MTAPEQSGNLQFEEVVPRDGGASAARSTEQVCTLCRLPFDLEYFDVNGQHVCRACSQKLAYLTETPRGIGTLGRSVLFGIGAAILGAVLYFAVLAISGFEIGLVAIAIGYMVGYGIRLGTRGRGGRRFQVLALVLTYWAMGLAYSSLAIQQLIHERSTAKSAAASTAQTGSSAQPTGAGTLDTAANEEDARPMTGREFVAGLLFLLGFTFVLPVIVVAGSLPGGLLSGAIIVFGMLQAWKMTAAPAVAVTGPYRIGATPAAG